MCPWSEPGGCDLSRKQKAKNKIIAETENYYYYPTIIIVS